MQLKQDQRDFSACSLGLGQRVQLRRLFDVGARPLPHARGLALRRSSTARSARTIGCGPFTSTDQFNFAPDNYYQRPDERKTAGLFAHYDFSEKASVYTEFMFMDDRTLAQIAASGAFLGGGPGQPPFFGDQVDQLRQPVPDP